MSKFAEKHKDRILNNILRQLISKKNVLWVNFTLISENLRFCSGNGFAQWSNSRNTRKTRSL